MLAPICVVTYSRIDHLRKVIDALKCNTLAKESELYIFSDAPKAGDEDKVRVVRDYCRTIDGFKAVHLTERATNSRVANNRGGIEQLLNEYGKVILLEDDVVTAPGFLAFMNSALDFYEHNDAVASISGYCPPMRMPKSYKRDVFTLTRFNPWGAALWKRYYKFNTPIDDKLFHAIFDNDDSRKQLARSVGEEALIPIEMDFDGQLDAGDMKAIFWQFCDKKVTVYPRKSLTYSIGQDGSGYHMGRTNKWHVRDVWEKRDGFEFSDEIAVDERIRRAHYRFYEADRIKNRVIKFLSWIGLYRHIRPFIKWAQQRIGWKTRNGPG